MVGFISGIFKINYEIKVISASCWFIARWHRIILVQEGLASLCEDVLKHHCFDYSAVTVTYKMGFYQTE